MLMACNGCDSGTTALTRFRKARKRAVRVGGSRLDQVWIEDGLGRDERGEVGAQRIPARPDPIRPELPHLMRARGAQRFRQRRIIGDAPDRRRDLFGAFGVDVERGLARGFRQAATTAGDQRGAGEMGALPRYGSASLTSKNAILRWSRMTASG